MKVRAAVANGLNQPLTIEEVDLREPEAGEVLVQMKASGICHTDLSVLEGNFPLSLPRILGHEGAGVVLACGEGVTTVKPGDHVLLNTNPECGVCPTCQSQKTNFCTETLVAKHSVSPFSRQGEPLDRMSHSTSFATHTVLKEYFVSPIPADVPFQSACLVGCGVMTGIGAVIFNAKVDAGSSVVVWGMGSIGLNAVQGARLAGAKRIVAIDMNPAKESVARLFGATDFVAAGAVEGSIVAHLQALLGGPADYAFECVGNVNLIAAATEVVNPFWGVTVAVGVPPHMHEIKLPAPTFYFGRSLKGTFIGNGKPRTDAPKIIQWYQDKKVLLDELVTHRITLDQINEGFDLMRSHKGIRCVIEY